MNYKKILPISSEIFDPIMIWANVDNVSRNLFFLFRERDRGRERSRNKYLLSYLDIFSLEYKFFCNFFIG